MTSFGVYNWDFEAYCEKQRLHLRGVAAWRERLGTSYEGSLLQRLEVELIDGLRRLDRLDRRDSFWNERNDLPTVGKLGDMCNIQLDARAGADPTFGWYDLAICVHNGGGRLAERSLWRLIDLRLFPVAWLVEASWLDRIAWGDTPLQMRQIAEQAGRLEEFKEVMAPYLFSEDPMLKDWANDEMAG